MTRLAAISLAVRLESAVRLGVGPLSEAEVDSLNELLMARHAARDAELDQRLKDLSAIVTEGEAA